MKMGNRRQSTPRQQQQQPPALPALIFGFILVCTVLLPPAIASFRAPIMCDGGGGGEGRLLATGDSGGRSAPRPPVHRFVGGFIDDSLINRDDRLSAPSHRRDHARKHHHDRGGCCEGTDVISTEATVRPDPHRREHTPTGVQRTTGPVHTYIKTDKNGHFKWGVRHFVGSKYAR